MGDESVLIRDDGVPNGIFQMRWPRVVLLNRSGSVRRVSHGIGYQPWSWSAGKPTVVGTPPSLQNSRIYFGSLQGSTKSSWASRFRLHHRPHRHNYSDARARYRNKGSLAERASESGLTREAAFSQNSSAAFIGTPQSCEQGMG